MDNVILRKDWKDIKGKKVGLLLRIGQSINSLSGSVHFLVLSIIPPYYNRDSGIYTSHERLNSQGVSLKEHMTLIEPAASYFMDRLKRRPKFIFFDVGGVLIKRNEPIHFSTLKELGIKSDNYEKIFLEFLANRPKHLKKEFEKIRTVQDQTKFFDESNRAMCEYFGVKPDKRLIKRMTKHSIKGSFFLLENTIMTLNELKKKYKMGIITNALPSRRENEIKDLGLEKYFQVIIISKETGFEKPSEEIYKLAAREAGVNMGDILFVDDIESNLNGAVAAGIDNVVLIGEPSDTGRYPIIRDIGGLLPLLKNTV